MSRWRAIVCATRLRVWPLSICGRWERVAEETENGQGYEDLAYLSLTTMVPLLLSGRCALFDRSGRDNVGTAKTVVAGAGVLAPESTVVEGRNCVRL
jgi:hypothetical protein